MTNKVALTRDGIDVFTALSGTIDPNDFIFLSDKNSPKIIATGIASFSTPGGIYTHNLAHGLSITPLPFAFCKADTNPEVILPGYQFFNTSPYHNVGFYEVRADSTNIIFYGRNFTTTKTLYFRYYIFETPL